MARVSLTDDTMCMNLIIEWWLNISHCDFLQPQLHYICLNGNFRKGRWVKLVCKIGRCTKNVENHCGKESVSCCCIQIFFFFNFDLAAADFATQFSSLGRFAKTRSGVHTH